MCVFAKCAGGMCVGGKVCVGCVCGVWGGDVCVWEGGLLKEHTQHSMHGIVPMPGVQHPLHKIQRCTLH